VTNTSFLRTDGPECAGVGADCASWRQALCKEEERPRLAQDCAGAIIQLVAHSTGSLIEDEIIDRLLFYLGRKVSSCYYTMMNRATFIEKLTEVQKTALESRETKISAGKGSKLLRSLNVPDCAKPRLLRANFVNGSICCELVIDCLQFVKANGPCG
jgi:hypothetical protein